MLTIAVSITRRGINVGDLLWFGPLRFLQMLFFHTPLEYIYTFGSDFYRDYIH